MDLSNLEMISIEQVVEDAELYPRNHYNWFIGNKYAKAMESGAVFPPITVSSLNGVYYLVDGKHRLEARKIRKETTIQVEDLKLKSREEIFAEAVKRNVVHGHALSTQETVTAIAKLRQMKFTEMQISGLVNIPVGRLQNFVAMRLVSTITGEELAVKAPLKNLAGTIVSVELENSQSVYASKSQEHVIDQLIALISSGAINTKNATVLNKLKILRKLIHETIYATRNRN